MKEWNAEVFKGLFLLYLTHTDDHFSEDESDYLKSKVSDQTLAQVKSFYRHASDSEILDKLMDGKSSFYPGTQGTEALMREVRDYFESDGVYSQWEKGVSHQLRRLLDMG
jgi:hypothetical protein